MQIVNIYTRNMNKSALLRYLKGEALPISKAPRPTLWPKGFFCVKNHEETTDY